jgi:hypothetical protein
MRTSYSITSLRPILDALRDKNEERPGQSTKAAYVVPSRLAVQQSMWQFRFALDRWGYQLKLGLYGKGIKIQAAMITVTKADAPKLRFAKLLGNGEFFPGKTGKNVN